MTKHLYSPTTLVTRAERSEQKKQRSAVVWLTGLSGAGKSTIAIGLDKQLTDEGYHSYVLDGDMVRAGLSKDLDFSDASRHENVRRIGEIARLFADAGILVLVALISPFRVDRAVARKIMPSGDFIEVYIKASFQVCQERDPKNLYRQAQQHKIKDFTGLDSKYEEPLSPEIVLNTEEKTPSESIRQLYDYLKQKGFLLHS